MAAHTSDSKIPPLLPHFHNNQRQLTVIAKGYIHSLSIALSLQEKKSWMEKYTVKEMLPLSSFEPHLV